MELIAAILILIPRTAWFGAILGAGAMCGALFFQLTSLGISVLEDGGLLFAVAIVVPVCCLSTLWLYREKILLIGDKI